MKVAGANPLGHFGYWATAAVIAMMGYTLYDSTVTSKRIAFEVDRMLEAIQDVSEVNEWLARAEAAQRGFLISGDEAFIAERDDAFATATENAATLKHRVSANPLQEARLRSLDELLVARLERMREVEKQRRLQGYEFARQRVTTAGAAPRSTRIYAITDDLRSHERRLLELKRAEQRESYNHAIVVLIAAVVISTAVLIPGYAGLIREARGRYKAEKKMANLAESLPGAVFQFRTFPDGRKRYEYLSGGTEALRGVNREAALRDPEVILGTIVDGDRKALLAKLAEQGRTLSPIEYDFRVKDRGGGIRWLRITAAPRAERDGSVLWSGHWDDVTEKKFMARALQESKDLAEAANRAKSTFLATMSHEIRTPMNGVLGMLELLSLSKLDGEQRTTLEVVRESGRSLLRIIDDILDFSKIEAGKLEIRPEVASIANVIERVRNIYAGNASSKGLLLKHYVDPAISPAVMVDPVRLQQILNNFVNNAIKFTVEGEVLIRADLVERSDGEDLVRFTVEDTGIGVSAEDHARLFKPFVQLSGESGERYSGTGLGLSICQRLAALMGGAITMESELGVGTAMRLALPLPIAEPVTLAATGAQPAERAVGGRRAAPEIEQARADGTLLMIVDDHPINRMVLLKQVNALGYAAAVAENGLEALDRWSAGDIAAIVTDCNMPEMNGYELARHIRSCESLNGHARTPIIACTANALGGEAENCYAAGMDDYLSKPIDLGRLAEKLDQWIPLAKARPAVDATALGNLPRIAIGTPIDPTVLAEISSGDPVVERDILQRFRVYNSEDATLLMNAILKADIAEVVHASHRIKGASKTIGAMSLAAVCDRLERASRANDWPGVNSSMSAFSEELNRVNAYVNSL